MTPPPNRHTPQNRRPLKRHRRRPAGQNRERPRYYEGGHALGRGTGRRWPLAWVPQPGDDRGNLTLEAVVIAPAMMMLLALLIMGGRMAIAGGSIEAVARDAARQASLARDPATARRNAQSSAQAALAREGLQCAPTVSVDTSEFGRAIGTPADVHVQVRCTVRLADLTVAGMPGHRTLSASFSSPIDPYRGKALGFTNSERSVALNRSVEGLDGPS